MTRAAKRILFCLMTGSALLISSATIGAPEPAAPVVLFEYSSSADGHHSVEPLAILEDRKVTALPEFKDDSTILDFIKRVYPKQKTLTIVQGGRQLGTATVSGDVDTSGCAYYSTKADVVPGAPAVAEAESGLALNSAKFAALTFKRRPQTDAEEKALQDAARAAFQSHKTAAPLIANMKPFFVTAYTSADNKTTFIAGSYLAEDPRPDSVIAPATLMLVMEQRGGDFKISYTHFHEGGDADYEMEHLVDLFDVDGDGVPELVTRFDYNESSKVAIYHRHGEQWDEIFQGAWSGC